MGANTEACQFKIYETRILNMEEVYRCSTTASHLGTEVQNSHILKEYKLSPHIESKILVNRINIGQV